MKRLLAAHATQFPTELVWRIYHRQSSGNAPSGKDLHTVLRALFPGIQIKMSDLTPFSHIQLFQIPIRESVPNIRKPFAEVLKENGETVNLQPKVVCTRGNEWREYAQIPV